MPRHPNSVAIVKADNSTTLRQIAGSDEIEYPQLLKKLWKHWKEHGLVKVEKIKRSD